MSKNKKFFIQVRPEHRDMFASWEERRWVSNFLDEYDENQSKPPWWKEKIKNSEWNDLNQKGRCRGEEQRIYLNPGQKVLLQSEFFKRVFFKIVFVKSKCIFNPGQQVLLQSAGFEGEGMPAECKVKPRLNLIFIFWTFEPTFFSGGEVWSDLGDCQSGPEPMEDQGSTLKESILHLWTFISTGVHSPRWRWRTWRWPAPPPTWRWPPQCNICKVFTAGR